MKKKYTILVLCLFLVACSEFNILDEDEQVPTLVVHGVLEAGKSPVINLGGVSAGSDTLVEIKDANVAIFHYNDVYELDYSGNGNYSKNYPVILPGETYFLQVDYKGQLLSSSTTIPLPPENLFMVSDFYITGDTIRDLVFFELFWKPVVNGIFLVDFPCAPINDFKEGFCEYYNEQNFPSTQSFYYFDDLGLIYGNFYQIDIYSINEEYAYLYYNEAFGEPYQNYSGNIDNGEGIFTGISSSMYTFQYMDVSTQGKTSSLSHK